MLERRLQTLQNLYPESLRFSLLLCEEWQDESVIRSGIEWLVQANAMTFVMHYDRAPRLDGPLALGGRGSNSPLWNNMFSHLHVHVPYYCAVHPQTTGSVPARHTFWSRGQVGD